MIILGIETSCDETALALMEARGTRADFECRVIASLVHSQADLHSAYGGVYPALAKREHGKNLIPLLHTLLHEAGLPAARHSHASEEDSLHSFRALAESMRPDVAPQNPELYESFAAADFLAHAPQIDAIAVTEGPGLEPALWVGITCARMLGSLWKIPVIPINHMEGHIIGSLLPSDATNSAWQKLHPVAFPALAFLISGGHTELVRINAFGSYEVIGETKDDAVGEAFDKAARLIGLPYPGGPRIAMLAEEARAKGIASPIQLPRPMASSGTLEFSFSGLKTAVLYAVRKAPMDAHGALDPVWKKGLALEFETAVAETLALKVRAALDQTGAQALIIGGGVSANNTLRQAFAAITAEYGIPAYMPSRHISGDNALMIAAAAALGHAHGYARAVHSGGTADSTAPGHIRAKGTKRLDERS